MPFAVDPEKDIPLSAAQVAVVPLDFNTVLLPPIPNVVA